MRRSGVCTFCEAWYWSSFTNSFVAWIRAVKGLACNIRGLRLSRRALCSNAGAKLPSDSDQVSYCDNFTRFSNLAYHCDVTELCGHDFLIFRLLLVPECILASMHVDSVIWGLNIYNLKILLQIYWFKLNLYIWSWEYKNWGRWYIIYQNLSVSKQNNCRFGTKYWRLRFQIMLSKEGWERAGMQRK